MLSIRSFLSRLALGRQISTWYVAFVIPGLEVFKYRSFTHVLYYPPLTSSSSSKDCTNQAFDQQKEIGAWNYLQVMEGLEGFTYALFTRQLGYSKEEVEVLCANIRKEMKSPKQHTLFFM